MAASCSRFTGFHWMLSRRRQQTGLFCQNPTHVIEVSPWVILRCVTNFYFTFVIFTCSNLTWKIDASKSEPGTVHTRGINLVDQRLPLTILKGQFFTDQPYMCTSRYAFSQLWSMGLCCTIFPLEFDRYDSYLLRELGSLPTNKKQDVWPNII